MRDNASSAGFVRCSRTPASALALLPSFFPFVLSCRVNLLRFIQKVGKMNLSIIRTSGNRISRGRAALSQSIFSSEMKRVRVLARDTLTSEPKTSYRAIKPPPSVAGTARRIIRICKVAATGICYIHALADHERSPSRAVGP